MLVICVQFGRALKNSFFSFFSLPIRAFGRWSFLIFWCGWKAMDIVMPLYCSSRNLFLRKLWGSAVDKHFFERVPVGDYSSLSIGLTLLGNQSTYKKCSSSRSITVSKGPALVLWCIVYEYHLFGKKNFSL